MLRSFGPGSENGPSGPEGARAGTDAPSPRSMRVERLKHESNLRCLSRPTPLQM